jgi:hypothetical protein
MGERKIVEKAFLLFFSTFVSLLVSVAATGRNGRVVEPLSHYPKAKGSSPATGTRREKMVEKVFLTFSPYFSLQVPAAMANRAGRVVEHLSQHPNAKGLTLAVNNGRQKNSGKAFSQRFSLSWCQWQGLVEMVEW